MTDFHRTVDELASIPDLCWVDVRAPREFARGHIPGAINLPILDDDERARVGLTYAQQGPDAAKLVGLELVGPRLAALVKRYVDLAAEGPVALYCWRGGMRSGLIGGVLRALGIPVLIARGGYRAHRHGVLRFLASDLPRLIVLNGCTGAGKTRILRYLSDRLPVVDLEGLGRHRGSTFGGVGLDPQPTQLQFESDLVAAFRRAGPGPVLIEGESPALGALKLPPELVLAMRTGFRLRVELPRAARVQVLIEEYAPAVSAAPDCLDLSFKYLGGRLPKQVLATLSESLASRNFEAFCDLLLERHYDPLYTRWLKRSVGLDHRVIEAGSVAEATAEVEREYASIAEALSDERGTPAGPESARPVAAGVGSGARGQTGDGTPVGPAES